MLQPLQADIYTSLGVFDLQVLLNVIYLFLALASLHLKLHLNTTARIFKSSYIQNGEYLTFDVKPLLTVLDVFFLPDRLDALTERLF